MSRTPSKNRLRAGIDDVHWWQVPMTMDDFIILSDGNEFYARHHKWKETILIGPYEAQDELSTVLMNYIKESKKHPFKQKTVNNFRTCVKPLPDTFNKI